MRKFLFAGIVLALTACHAASSFAQSGGFPSRPNFRHVQITGTSGNGPHLEQCNTSGSSTNQCVRNTPNASSHYLQQLCDDTSTTCGTYFDVTRSGNTASAIDITASAFRLNGTANSLLTFIDGAASAGNKVAAINTNAAGKFRQQLCADDLSLCTAFFDVTRSGTTATAIDLTATVINANGSSILTAATTGLTRYADAAPIFSNAVQSPTFSVVNATAANYRSYNSTSTTTNRAVQTLVGTSGNYNVQYCDDAFGTCATIIGTNSRSGNTAGSIELNATAVNVNGVAIPKYSDATANFTGTLQQGGNPVTTYTTGTFNFVLATGCTVSTNIPITYTKVGNLVNLRISNTSCTSNAASRLSGASDAPAAIRPSSTRRCLLNVLDNSAATLATFAITSGGQMVFNGSTGTGGFTASGTWQASLNAEEGNCTYSIL